MQVKGKASRKKGPRSKTRRRWKTLQKGGVAKILAVAVGAENRTSTDVCLNDNVKHELDALRPIIKDGLVPGLEALGHARRRPGPPPTGDFDIDYVADLPYKLQDAITDYLKQTTPNVIFAVASTAARAAKKAVEGLLDKPITPVVFVVVSDPDKEGLVKDILEPEGFVTGVSTMLRHTVHRGLRYFKNARGDLKTVYGIYRKGFPPAENSQKRLKKVAGQIGVRYVPLNYKPPAKANDPPIGDTLKQIIDGLPRAGDPTPAGLLMVPDDLVVCCGRDVIARANARGLATFVQVVELTKDGALGGYGIPADVIGNAGAECVHEIVWNGTRPGDVPVEYLTDFVRR